MKIIKKNSIDKAIENIISKGNYIFCICLGMQLLASESFEDKFTKVLGSYQIRSINLPSKKQRAKFLMLVLIKFFERGNKLFKGLSPGTDFYFVHSYRILPEKMKKYINNKIWN